MKRTFSNREIAVTLTGEEWFVILILLSNPLPSGQFSPKGLDVWIKAHKKFLKQIDAAQKEVA